MKTLLLLRHAKSGYPSGVGDFDRPLNPRGRRTAARMGEYLAAENLLPDYALCSAASRARETYHFLCIGMNRTPAAIIEPKLYLAAPSTLLEHIRAAPANAATLLVVAHNPGLQNFALDLAGGAKTEPARMLAEKYPTAGLAAFQCAIDEWDDLTPARATLLRFVKPRQLMERA